MSAAGTWRIVRLCAAQELTIAIRSRWTQGFAIVFGGIAIAIASAGSILSGDSGLQDFGRTAASLLQLVLLIVPLTALAMGVLALTPERGGAELLYAQPVRRSAVLAGTLLGLFEALASAQAVGFGAAGLILFWRVGNEGVTGFLFVGLTSLVLTAVFLSLAAVLSVGEIGRRRVRALARALVVWLILALAFDLVVLGVASFLRSGHASRLIIVSSIVNPIDAARTAALLIIEGLGAFGPASLAFLRLTHGAAGAAAAIAMSLSLWALLPFAAAAWRLSRIDIR
jgi:Cu-processing system permease protein